MVGYHRETHHFSEGKSTKNLPPRNTPDSFCRRFPHSSRAFRPFLTRASTSASAAASFSSGVGLVGSSWPHIFDRYYQEGSEHQASGTGIGLALVKNLVVLHEGEIRVESSLNVGSTFYVSLLTDNTYPHVLHADSTEKTSDEKDEKEENIEPVHSGKRILLIVEDNRDICDYIVESFSDDFEVRTAANGEQGLEQALGCIPDIIVSDIMMPVMNGIVMCRKLKEYLRTSHIPIILLTAMSTSENKLEGVESGADAYITKPFSSRLLLARIFQLIEQREKLKRKFSNDPAMTSQALCSTELDRKFGEKLQTILEKQLDNPEFTIEDFASAVGVSRAAFFRKVKGVTGYTPNEYMRILRMKRAMELLQEGIYNVSEIAYKVGMNDPLYFSKCFKSHFGAPPSAYLHKK